MAKLISFVVPCYNAAAWMERCVESILSVAASLDGECELILIDDGSTDETAAICDRYAACWPRLVRVVHQENGGHGEGINQGLRLARGLYFKVVDSDDWLDGPALRAVLERLRTLAAQNVDLVITNYVYEHGRDGKRKVMRYGNVFPPNEVVTWRETNRFLPPQFLLMHSVIYRTAVLRASGLSLPRHTFYVDNIFVYLPLPFVRTICYLNVDLYRYFIGREGQSVNESVMLRQIDQQVRVTRIMIGERNLTALRKEERILARYMRKYLAMMLSISSFFLIVKGTPESLAECKALWDFLRASDPGVYRRCAYSFPSSVVHPRRRLSRPLLMALYKAARKVWKFN